MLLADVGLDMYVSSWDGVGIDLMHNLFHGLAKAVVSVSLDDMFTTKGTIRKDRMVRVHYDDGANRAKEFPVSLALSLPPVGENPPTCSTWARVGVHLRAG